MSWRTGKFWSTSPFLVTAMSKFLLLSGIWLRVRTSSSLQWGVSIPEFSMMMHFKKTLQSKNTSLQTNALSPTHSGFNSWSRNDSKTKLIPNLLAPETFFSALGSGSVQSSRPHISSIIRCSSKEESSKTLALSVQTTTSSAFTSRSRGLWCQGKCTNSWGTSSKKDKIRKSRDSEKQPSKNTREKLVSFRSIKQRWL